MGFHFTLVLLHSLPRMGDKGRVNVSVPTSKLFVPLHSALQTLLPRSRLRPSKGMQLAAVDGVPKVVEHPVGNECYKLFLSCFEAEALHDLLGDLYANGGVSY